ncbi:hypothetical protein FJV46_10520 [Arthrobacter agilis]|uniref:hypothetical protein n=1 Tax=Arthrobacter agilis TaxID=37921 RepID=UPI000B34DB8C|nr:hypothetical protein [Arthrobacter agilis]OUM44189.1 hypothetical protein B8W74_04760 [Arthrobacter agilis]PPB46564.1 hypothetical protein CI784_07055 [Arthrobacter agilis]TPV23780.1 hypothetical protein FJV46_10520 [Arthrobacter agilis]VDR32510.1 Uncharacterised protein [Arthrobacter agilis]
MADLHLIFTDYEQFGYAVTSPQIPGLVAAYDTMAEALGQVPALEALVDSSATTWLHEQKVASTPDGDEYLVRFLGIDQDEAAKEQRNACVGRMLASIESGTIDDSSWRKPQLRTGERLLVCVAPTDLLGWCLDQLTDDEGMTLQMNPHTDIVYGVAMLKEGSMPNAKSLEELGLARGSTVQNLFDKVIAAEVSDLKISVHG